MLDRHFPIGASTGWWTARERARGRLEPDWTALVTHALEVGSDACELAALSEPELTGLVSYLKQGPSLPFGFLSIHAPSKQRTMREADLVRLLCSVSGQVDAIVLHCDVIENHDSWRQLGSLLTIENLDPRKADGRTAESLVRHFDALPDARICFDVAHAQATDPTLQEGHAILDAFGERLSHLHVSALDAEHHHVALGVEEEERIRPLLERCRDVPWILEAPIV